MDDPTLTDLILGELVREKHGCHESSFSATPNGGTCTICGLPFDVACHYPDQKWPKIPNPIEENDGK